MPDNRKIIDEYDLPDLYDLRIGGEREDVKAYIKIAAKTGGPVLELGCGTGRVAIPLALEGHEVVGIDKSERMLERARKKAEEKGAINLKLYQADMKDFSLEERFRLALIPDNAFHELIELEDKKECLIRIFDHLLPGGVLALDFCPPPSKRFNIPDEERVLFREFYSDERKANVKCYYSRSVNPETQITEGEMIYELHHDDGKVSEIIMPFKGAFITDDEMKLLLESTGFIDIRISGDFSGSDLTPESERMVVKATRPES